MKAITILTNTSAGRQAQALRLMTPDMPCLNQNVIDAINRVEHATVRLIEGGREAAAVAVEPHHLITPVRWAKQALLGCESCQMFLRTNDGTDYLAQMDIDYCEITKDVAVININKEAERGVGDTDIFVTLFQMADALKITKTNFKEGGEVAVYVYAPDSTWISGTLHPNASNHACMRIALSRAIPPQVFGSPVVDEHGQFIGILTSLEEGTVAGEPSIASVTVLSAALPEYLLKTLQP